MRFSSSVGEDYPAAAGAWGQARAFSQAHPLAALPQGAAGGCMSESEARKGARALVKALEERVQQLELQVRRLEPQPASALEERVRQLEQQVRRPEPQPASATVGMWRTPGGQTWLLKGTERERWAQAIAETKARLAERLAPATKVEVPSFWERGGLQEEDHVASEATPAPPVALPKPSPPASTAAVAPMAEPVAEPMDVEPSQQTEDPPNPTTVTDISVQTLRMAMSDLEMNVGRINDWLIHTASPAVMEFWHKRAQAEAPPEGPVEEQQTPPTTNSVTVVRRTISKIREGDLVGLMQEVGDAKRRISILEGQPAAPPGPTGVQEAMELLRKFRATEVAEMSAEVSKLELRLRTLELQKFASEHPSITQPPGTQLPRA